MIVDEEVEVGAIEDAIRTADLPFFDDVKLFDIYRGIPIPPGKKSVAYSVTYRSPERTLVDAEADASQNKLAEILKEKFHAVIRDA